MRKQILVVEDNERNRAILTEILSDSYDVLEAENGLQALTILQRKKEDIALILLDVMMPVMDGYAVLERMQEDAELSRIPVIVMTQGNSEEDEVAALSHGATDFVSKPYRPQVILHRVASLIKLRENAAMIQLFQYDHLTGLFSREYFCQEARKMLLQNPRKAYSLICLNVENFKRYNDMYGIRAGDRLLRKIADFFRGTIGEKGIYGRYRGDQFICLMERNETYYYRIANGKDGRFCNVLPGNPVTTKWGIYEISDPQIPVERMCDRALLAVKSIKGQDNQHFAIYDDSIRDALLREKAVTDAMEAALAEQQFLVYYQPKFSLKSSCMAGAEALVRWTHPKLGWISPGEFIPILEKNGFLPKLDLYIWETVCANLRDWKERGMPLIPVSVNVSRADVYRLDLVDTLSRLVQKYGIAPNYLHLEITESTYSDNPNQLISTVKKLRSLGFVIEMDDFGNGSSSLNMLSRMELDVLKLDMEFIRNEISKPAERCILSDLIIMAHRMQLVVVAEGVETREQMNHLYSAGCDYVQGYFFARPMPAEAFETLLKNQNPQTIEQPRAPRIIEDRNSLLIVDENAAYRAKVRKVLDAQYHLLEAADADSAINCIRSRNEKRISAVILSMTLPEGSAASVMQVLRRERDFWQIPVLATISNGNEMDQLSLAMDADDFLCKYHPLSELHRRIQRLMDIATFQHRERILQDKANRDHLTGLLNRRGLQDAVNALQREKVPMAVYMFDLNRFKSANDSYGHDEGDRMLQTFADLLRRQTRPEDIRCRYGGDEFLVILRQITTEKAAMARGNKICQAFRGYQLPDGSATSCSGGIALCSPQDTLEEAIKWADAALYRAKKENKGTCCLWHGEETRSC